MITIHVLPVVSPRRRPVHEEENLVKSQHVALLFARAYRRRLLTELCESILASDSDNDYDAVIDAAKEWDLL